MVPQKWPPCVTTKTSWSKQLLNYSAADCFLISFIDLWPGSKSVVQLVLCQTYLSLKDLAESFPLEKAMLAEVSIKTLSSWPFPELPLKVVSLQIYNAKNVQLWKNSIYGLFPFPASHFHSEISFFIPKQLTYHKY